MKIILKSINEKESERINIKAKMEYVFEKQMNRGSWSLYSPEIRGISATKKN